MLAQGRGAAHAATQLANQLAKQHGTTVTHHGVPPRASFNPHYHVDNVSGHIFYKLSAGAGVLFAYLVPAPVQAAKLFSDALLAGADYLMNSGTPIGQGSACSSQGGPPGGDDLFGQFLGGFGTLNRPR